MDLIEITTKEFSDPEILTRAQELQQKNNLPIVICDQYMLKINQKLDKNDRTPKQNKH